MVSLQWFVECRKIILWILWLLYKTLECDYGLCDYWSVIVVCYNLSFCHSCQLIASIARKGDLVMSIIYIYIIYIVSRSLEDPYTCMHIDHTLHWLSHYWDLRFPTFPFCDMWNIKIPVYANREIETFIPGKIQFCLTALFTNFQVKF